MVVSWRLPLHHGTKDIGGWKLPGWRLCTDRTNPSHGDRPLRDQRAPVWIPGHRQTVEGIIGFPARQAAWEPIVPWTDQT